MSRDTASRDVKLNALAVLTGGITTVAFLGTGLATGLAADYTSQKTQAKAEAKAAAAPAVAAPRPVATACRLARRDHCNRGWRRDPRVLE